ncbi:exodeoxyribonuclease V subunit alpha [Xanthomonas citri pv. fuscans CFBP 6996]|uniref:AAA family ATPase n=1 Tax=Xanthomonas citri TaxID=346 RepID=UPI000C19BBAD|nr:AAA family ATPase [Xanthomonas citri]PTY28934.1 exodeoxyribonuclease V subunit alpha [Xanthomonas citri pv. fuscans CFBP 6996]ATS37046.1 AAA family ATPase [Xanthomonas citri pv. phaseoli var. fuscans]ATS44145.1 AAA family ATPase [Xanthomonas citri pv. phaseoli var. fuscans]ATS49803.1 AAA family ATPase [Xanthomonas citri pv. phaseoli var. fuscans]ATS60447.1 AAA family ATPase [Xanthomonas citri pv. phaseoli var. fuscans]
MTHPNLLTALNQSGALRTLDLVFAQSLQRLAPDTDPQVLAGAALASLAVTSGHAGLDPARAAMLLDARDGPSPTFPDPADWQRSLAASRWVDQPQPKAPAATDCPLVLERGLLYLRRYREYERRLALGLQRIAAQAPPPVDAATLAPLFAQLFPNANPTPLPSGEGARRAGEGTGLPAPSLHDPIPPTPSHTPDRQAQAAALALRRALLLVTGGPGTGKTTTIARLLLLRIAQAHASNTPAPRIALAAPTGRAAERMAESLRAAIARAITDGIRLPAAESFATSSKSADLSTSTRPTNAAAPDASAFASTAAGLEPPTHAAQAASQTGSPKRPQPHAPSDQGEPPSWEALLPSGASTLHRLLGVIPDSPHFRHDADNPLPLDLIVVDEASMVDLPLMCKLVEAVADGTQLILLGDADQLPSVEAGDVLAAILQAAGPGDALQPEDAQALQPLLGSAPVERPPAVASATRSGGLAGHRVHLLRGYRQAEDFALAPLADAIRAGDADTALTLLRSGELPGVHFHEDGEDPLALGRDALLAHWRALANAQDPAAALRDAGRLRLLTAVRAGPHGARGLNARIEQLLADTGSGARRLGGASPWFQGRLLLITENSYRHGLFNGDVGICLRSDPGSSLVQGEARAVTARGHAAPSRPGHAGDSAHRDAPAPDSRAQGPLVAWFEGDGDGQVRGFHPAALPAHESAFAMTVHKAQGSEFDEVWLQLPIRDARVLSRELLYTGITRARRALHLAGSEAVIRSALARHAARISGLAWRLGGEQMQSTADAASPLRATTPTVLGNPIQGSLF